MCSVHVNVSYTNYSEKKIKEDKTKKKKKIDC